MQKAETPQPSRPQIDLSREANLSPKVEARGACQVRRLRAFVSMTARAWGLRAWTHLQTWQKDLIALAIPAGANSTWSYLYGAAKRLLAYALHDMGYSMGFHGLTSLHVLLPARFRRDVLSFLGALVVSAVFYTPTISADRAGQVEEVKGEAFADASNQHRALEKASSLFVGDRVATGPSSRLSMLLGKDTTIRLGESAQIIIDKFLSKTGGEISLESGPMLFERPAGSRPAPIQFKGSYGLIAVRGTKFFAGPSNGVFGVFVDYGTVLVSGGGTRVVLRAGEGTNLSSPGSKPTAPVRWGQERIRNALNSVN